MKVRTLKVLEAGEGKVLTNGEIHGKIIYLAEGLDESSFYEITEEEYESLFPVNELEGGIEDVEN